MLNIIKYISPCLDNINPADDSGDTVMHWAAAWGKLPIVNWYLENLKENNKILQVLANCFVSGTMTLCIRLNLLRIQFVS